MGTKIVYNHRAIEKKWRERWEENPVNPKVDDNGNKKQKYYCLDMFPYPSGNGLHVGHWRGYVISDVWSRYKLQQGYYIIHPMGWDAFGLPAENYAIKMGVHPAKSTAENVANIKKQINDIAALYDWDMEVNTTDPNFYKWTQWIFVKMFKAGLAYEKEFPINWCPSCKTGLANEEVVNGKCERCGAEVTKKNLRQWMLRITKYADRLLDDLDKLDWPEKVKKMQTDWIGKSYGAEVDFQVEGRDEKITVYTTRPDTLYGATFMVLAPEHKLAASLATDETREAVEKYIYEASMKSNVDRMQDKEKTGVFTGSYAINPLITVSAILWGVVPGAMGLRLAKGSTKRKTVGICASVVVAAVLSTIIFNTAGMVLFMGYSLYAILPGRLIQFAVMTPLLCVITVSLYLSPLTQILAGYLRERRARA